MSLTTDVLTLIDEVTNYFGGDYEGYTQIEETSDRISEAFRAEGTSDKGEFALQLVPLTSASVDALLAALAGYTMHHCAVEEHPHEGGCDGWPPDEAEALIQAETVLMKAGVPVQIEVTPRGQRMIDRQFHELNAKLSQTDPEGALAELDARYHDHLPEGANCPLCGVEHAAINPSNLRG